MDDVHIHSNHRNDPKVYNLVVCGAVHINYSNEAVHLIETLLKKLKTTESNKASNTATVLQSEGEIEIMIYIYWQLVTQDLISWKDDVPRKASKLLLAQCWTRLKTTVDKIKSGEVKARGSNEFAKKALDMIQKFAKFEDTTHLSACCIYIF